MYFEQFCEERCLQKETIKGYKSSIKKYTQNWDMTLDELIDEAIEEEDNNISKRKRKIKKRLLQFRADLLSSEKLEVTTIKGHITKIKTIYNYFEVDIPDLPHIKEKTTELTYMDLPNRRHIKEAFQLAGIQDGSLILFMASSGTGRTECANMKVKDFIQACEGYYTETELIPILEEMQGSMEQIVPTFTLFRQKTQKKYYTFCTPEATNAIIEWLLLRNELLEDKDEKLYLDDSLWDYTVRQISHKFQCINDALDYGFKKKYRFFRPHSLRKFHASNIGLSQENVDFLQGRSKDQLHATYIKANPERLKNLYMDVMDNISIKDLNKKEIIHEDFTININLNFYGKEYGVNI